MSWGDLLSIDFLKFALPAAGAVWAWLSNERRRRVWRDYQRKEQRYRQLMRSLRGFYVADADRSKKQAFLDQVNLCWLYCPDDVIRKLYAFLDTVSAAGRKEDREKELALAEVIAAIRGDLIYRRPVRRTSLTAADFRHLTAT